MNTHRLDQTTYACLQVGNVGPDHHMLYLRHRDLNSFLIVITF